MKPKLIRITTVPISLDKLLGKQLSFMNQFFRVTAVSADEEELKKVAGKYGVQYHHVEMTRTISPIKDLKAVWKLYRFLKQEKPEIVHSHTPKAGIVGMMAAYFAKIPVRMHTVAGLPLMESTGVKRKILDTVEKLTYRFATHVYPNSEGLKEFIVKEKFCLPQKLSIIANGSSNGIDTAYFSSDQISEAQKATLKNVLGISKDDFVFVFVGRLVGDKGINELVKAFSNLKLETLHLKLILVGPFESELDPLFPETLTEIENNPNIISVGFQSDVRPYFAISSALVFPSYREGFPNVVMQAGAMGLPSIVTDINGCNEIIVEGGNGLIIPVKNSDALQSAMQKMTGEKQVFEEMAENARPMIASRYEQSVVWAALLKEYRRILSHNNDMKKPSL